MDDLVAARLQMASSLGFHIIFAGLGIGLPLFMLVAEGLWLRTGPAYLALARRWSKAFALIFAVGAVSGTILSFELGLLWPGFMKFAGGIIGMPFSAEGFAFFIEAIFLGMYLYGWNRLTPRTHWLTGFPVAISGLLSGIFVVSANAWMNSPSGFRIVDGKVVDVDPVAAMFNGAYFQDALHMSLAAFEATAFAVAGIYAFGFLRGRGDQYHRAALTVSLAIGVIIALLQPISGDLSARWVAENQPVKFAALEGQFQTESHAGLRIGGIPDTKTRETKYALELPGMLSFLAHGNFDAEVQGLDEWPIADQPNPLIVHIAFQLMVGIGFSLIGLGLWFWIWARRSKEMKPGKLLTLALTAATPAGFIAIEAGWTVTEVGRQPWAIYEILRTEDAVTTVPNQFVALGGYTVVYVVLAVALVWLLLRLAKTPPMMSDPRLQPEMADAVE
jgi:cytochrome bd ubiquinol oxidase subunit I